MWQADSAGAYSRHTVRQTDDRILPRHPLTTMGNFSQLSNRQSPGDVMARFNFFQQWSAQRSVRLTYRLLTTFLNSKVSWAAFGTTPTAERRGVRTVMLMGSRRACYPNPSPRAAGGLSRRLSLAVGISAPKRHATGTGLVNQVRGGILLAGNAVAWIALVIALVTVR